ncbi:hypothetical protein Tco_0620157, partial [Tanacetum coccineum]
MHQGVRRFWDSHHEGGFGLGLAAGDVEMALISTSRPGVVGWLPPQPGVVGWLPPQPGVFGWLPPQSGVFGLAAKQPKK